MLDDQGYEVTVLGQDDKYGYIVSADVRTMLSDTMDKFMLEPTRILSYTKMIRELERFKQDFAEVQACEYLRVLQAFKLSPMVN